MKVIVLFVCLAELWAMVPDPIVKRLFTVGGETVHLKSTKKGFEWEEKLYWRGKEVETFKSDLNRSSLYSIQPFYSLKYRRKKSLVFITWNKGAHSQTMEVWSFPEGKRVWQQTSYYAGYATIKDDQLHITYYRDPNTTKKVTLEKLISFD